MPDTYTTRSGDTWDGIAYREMGSCRHTELLMNANRKHLDTFIFSAGTVLTIPDAEKSEIVAALPPWRKTS